MMPGRRTVYYNFPEGSATHHTQRRCRWNLHTERRITMTKKCMIVLVTFLSLSLIQKLLHKNDSNGAVVVAFGMTAAFPSRVALLRRLQTSGSEIHAENIVESPLYGNMHGTNSCFLPLQQLEQDTYMPRIINIVSGIYPSNDITIESIQMTPKSEYAPALGQWTYTFQTPIDDDIPVQASIALEGSNIVATCEDPIIVIAEHTSLNIVLPAAITEPVDLLVLIDRSKTYFSERKFLLFAVSDPEQPQVRIAAFHTRNEIPSNAVVLGHVEQVTIPWLPAMAPTKTGFLEADEYY